MLRLYFSKKEQFAVAILVVAVLAGIVLLSYAYKRHAGAHQQPVAFFQPAATPDVSTEIDRAGAPLPTTPPATGNPQGGIVVHVAGAVKHPGVVTLPAGARVNDAVEKAGGAAQNGYPDALNLAAKLEDGEKITIPTRAEWEKANAGGSGPALVQLDTGGGAATESPSAIAMTSSTGAGNSGRSGGAGKSSSGKKVPPTGKISLNHATLEQLMSLPGVGQVTAQHILDFRTAHGKFTDINELRNIPRMGEKSLAKITPYLVL